VLLGALGDPTGPGAPTDIEPAGPPIEGPPITSDLTISMFLIVVGLPLKRAGLAAKISPGIIAWDKLDPIIPIVTKRVNRIFFITYYYMKKLFQNFKIAS
jgi:hypothetical protein